MNRFISFLRDRHDEIYKIFLVLFSIAVIVYLFPKEGKFRYDIENLKGKPWPYEDLIAQFDFAINKSTEDIKLDKDDVMRNSKYYFRADDVAKEKARSNYQEKLKEQVVKKRNAFLENGIALFDSVYKRG